MTTFSDNLTKYRERANMSRKELAHILGVSVSSIGFYETGRNEPDLQKLQQIARVLKVSTDDLLGYSAVPMSEFEKLKARLDGYGLDVKEYKDMEEELESEQVGVAYMRGNDKGEYMEFPNYGRMAVFDSRAEFCREVGAVVASVEKLADRQQDEQVEQAVMTFMKVWETRIKSNKKAARGEKPGTV